MFNLLFSVKIFKNIIYIIQDTFSVFFFQLRQIKIGRAYKSRIGFADDADVDEGETTDLAPQIEEVSEKYRIFICLAVRYSHLVDHMLRLRLLSLMLTMMLVMVLLYIYRYTIERQDISINLFNNLNK